MNKRVIVFISFIIILVFGGYYLFTSPTDNKNDKFQVTIIGKKNDATANKLHETALKFSPPNAHIVWWDGVDSNKIYSDIKYPVLKKSAAYVCVKLKCSLPNFTSEQLKHTIQAFSGTTDVPKTTKINTQSSPTISADTEKNKLEEILYTKSWWIIIPLFWFLGLLLSVTPCVLPLMLIVTSILGSRTETVTKKTAFLLSFTYIISLSFTYAIAGVVVAAFGFYIQAYMQNKWILGAFSLLFVMLGISLFGFYSVQIPNSLRKSIASYSKAHGSGSYIGVALMGVLATLIASPCVAAPLAGILAYIAESGNVKLGAIALFSTGMGIGTPIIIVSTIGIGLLQKAGEWQKYIKQFFGILLFAIAIWLLERILYPKVIMFLWAALAIFTAIYMGALENQRSGSKSNAHLNNPKYKIFNSLTKMISIIILVYGGAILAGALIGNTNPLSPLERRASSDVSAPLSFKHVKNINELENEIHLAQILNKPVLLVYTADWCTSCKEMHENVFTNNEVKILMQRFVLLYSDLTNNDPEIVTFAKHYSVVGPPVILFFKDSSQKPIDRIDGAAGTEKLSSVLNGVLKN